MHKHHDFYNQWLPKTEKQHLWGHRHATQPVQLLRLKRFWVFVRAQSLFCGPVRPRTKSMGFMTLKAHKVNSTVPIMFHASWMARKYCTWHLINFVRGFKHNRNIRHMLNQRAASHLTVTHLHLNRKKAGWGLCKTYQACVRVQTSGQRRITQPAWLHSFKPFNPATDN